MKQAEPIKKIKQEFAILGVNYFLKCCIDVQYNRSLFVRIKNAVKYIYKSKITKYYVLLLLADQFFVLILMTKNG